MNKNSYNFFQLDYSHEDLEFLLEKIKKGYVLSEKDYNALKSIGIDNISTFSGDYNDLKNIPDIVKQIEDAMAVLDIETKTNSTNKIASMSNALKKEIAEVANESNKAIATVKDNLTRELNDAKTEIGASIDNIEKVIENSIETAMVEMSGKLSVAENKIAENVSSINKLQQDLNEVPNELSALDDRVESLEHDVNELVTNPPKGMTDEERALLNEVANTKFDNIEVRNKMDEEGTILNEMVFYSNGKVVKTVEFTGGGGGGGSFNGGTLETTMDLETSVSEKDSVVIPYSFKSPNFGTAILYVTVVNGASSKEVEYTVRKQGAGSVNLGVLTKGINMISMYVIDSFSQMTNIVELTVVVGALEISSTFDDGKDFESYNAITIPINLSPLDPSAEMTLYANIDGKIYTQQVYNGFNNYSIPAEAKTVGVHKITIDVRSDKYVSNKLEYSIVIVDRTALLISTKNENLEVEIGYNMDLNFRVSTTYTSTFTAEYYLDDKLYSTGSVDNGDNLFTISYRDLVIKDYVVKIVVKSADGVMTGELIINAKVIPSQFERIEHVEGGLQAYFDMSVKTNSDPDRDVLRSMVPMDNGQYAEIKLHDYNYATNGWIDGRLVNNGKAWAEIDGILPLQDNVLEGFTFDILFKNYNSGIAEARVIDCMGTDPKIGFYIDSELAVAKTDANELNTYYTDRQDMRVTFVVNRTSTYYEEYIIDPETGHSILNPNPTYKPNPMIQTYIDGIFTDVAMLSDSGSGNNKIYESFMNTEKILINTDKMKEVFGNNEIKSIRIYNRPLEHEEVLQNYMADYDDLVEQKAIYDKNYVTVDSDLPTLYFYDSDIGKCDLMTKDNKQWINIVYTSPNKDKFGESFDLMGQCQWQGTSSLAYPVKNYKFKLYDWARDEEGNIIEALRNDKDSYTKKKINLYPSDGNGHKENTFCLKVDYMDSSHCRNTGTARLVNDFLFDGHPNPAKQVDPKTRDTINGFPCQLYINGKWIGLCNFNHDKSCTKTLGLETIPDTVRWEIKANSDSSAGAFIKTWGNDVNACYDAILTDFEIVFDEDAFEEKTGVYDVTKYYDELGFAHNGAVIGSYYDYAILSLARFVNFVSGANEQDFKEKAGQYFDVVQACRYYLNVMTLGMIDNFAKNCIINMYGDDIWWFSFYDMDSSLGLDNTGYKKFECNIEPSQPGIYNCSTSRMWVKLNEYLKDELFDQFKLIREGKYTYENICDYLIGKQIDVIPPILYNRDMYTKYISQGRQYLHMLHGNNKDHLKRWLYNRFQYVDSLFLQHNSPYTKQNITIRSCAPADAVPKRDEQGNIISPYTARFEIQTYSPQYVTVCWRKNTFETKRIDFGETVVFECDMVNSQDNELIIYCASNLKSLGDCSGLNPTTADIGAANRLIEFKCENSDKLLKADISKNTFLNKVSFKGCSMLGTATGGSNILDISNSTNLREIDIRGTKITSVLTNPKGGNLQSILYPDAIQTISLDNQVNLEVVGVPFENGIATANNLATVNISNCNNIKHLCYPYNEEDALNFDALKYVQYLTINNALDDMPVIRFNNFDKLREINISNMPYLQDIDFIDLLPKNAVSTFEKIFLANIPQVQDISFNVNSDNYKIAFVDGAVIDLGALNLKSIESNTGIKGANKLILPVGLKELKFTTEFGGEGDIRNIWSYNAVHVNDGFEGMDLKDMNLTHIDMSGLPQITHAVNFNITPADQNPNLNAIRDGEDKPFFRPEGTINLNNYTGSMVNVLKGVDLGKLNVVLTNPKVQNNLTSLFEGAIIPADKLNVVNNLISRFEYANTLDNMFKKADLNGIVPSQINLPLQNRISLKGMFEGSNVTADFQIPEDNVTAVDNMFKDCLGITELTPNWEKSYNLPMTFEDCYLGCTNADLDQVPAAWGGYGFNTQSTGIYVINAPEDNYVLHITNSPDLIFSKGYVNWGDGTITRLSQDNLTHTYAKAGLYEVKAQCIPGGMGVPLACADALIEVKQLPTDARNFNSCFQNAVNLQRVTAYGLIFDNLGMHNMFLNCSNLTEIIGMETWNTASVADMGSAFSGCTSLQKVNLENFDTSNATSIFHLFYNCKSLTELKVSHFKTPRLVNAQNAFYGCELITELDFTGWTTEAVVAISGFVYGCKSLVSIKGLEGFNIEKCSRLSAMFQECARLESLDLSAFNAINIVNFDFIIQNCTDLKNFVSCKNIQADISVKTNNNLSVDSLVSIIDNLMVVNEARTFTVGETNFEKLTSFAPEKLQEAIDKGWSVVA